mmetsp:Transcript_87392/g.182878  ORF Transcript_87392/g.182878 Transcript_87392/m.182878 type:complete len:247 (-) Transcript_87392:40-780(-)
MVEVASPFIDARLCARMPEPPSNPRPQAGARRPVPGSLQSGSKSSASNYRPLPLSARDKVPPLQKNALAGLNQDDYQHHHLGPNSARLPRMERAVEDLDRGHLATALPVEQRHHRSASATAASPSKSTKLTARATSRDSSAPTALTTTTAAETCKGGFKDCSTTHSFSGSRCSTAASSCDNNKHDAEEEKSSMARSAVWDSEEASCHQMLAGRRLTNRGGRSFFQWSWRKSGKENRYAVESRGRGP